VVSRVRIRATTITNWDKQEFIVPNKDFITGRLLNWTLTDTLNRIVVKVGIAYGSDVTLARETIARVCADNQYLLKDPAPLITLEGFGASSLDFVVRAYLPKLDDRLTTIHELHRDIDLAFRDAGIEISFPQLDLHVRDIAAPVETRVTQN
ncbi:MAG: mechanosensitive ion channel domain-containing protein, partial [Planctomycetota bacterium]